MALDLDQVRKRIEAKTQKGNGQNFEKTDWSTIFFKPKVGEQTIRIVPAIWNKSYPIKSVWYHEFNIFKRTVYALRNWAEKDPVEEFRKKLYADAKTMSETAFESKDLAEKIKIKEKFYVPVIVRGQEDKGVLLWEFSSKTEEKLLAILGKKKLGDITDIMEGRDLEIEGTNASTMIGKKSINYVEVSIMPDMTTSPLSDNPALVKKWLTEQKDPLELHKKYEFQEIKDMFAKWLDPDAEDSTPPEAPEPKFEAKVVPKKPVPEQEQEDAELVPFVPDPDEDEQPPVIVKKIPPKAPAKTPNPVKGTAKAVSAAAKFNAVFEDDEE